MAQVLQNQPSVASNAENVSILMKQRFMTTKEIAAKLRKQGEELRRKAEYLIHLAQELEAAAPAKPNQTGYDEQRINSELALALAQKERKMRSAG